MQVELDAELRDGAWVALAEYARANRAGFGMDEVCERAESLTVRMAGAATVATLAGAGAGLAGLFGYRTVSVVLVGVVAVCAAGFAVAGFGRRRMNRVTAARSYTAEFCAGLLDTDMSGEATLAGLVVWFYAQSPRWARGNLAAALTDAVGLPCGVPFRVAVPVALAALGVRADQWSDAARLSFEDAHRLGPEMHRLAPALAAFVPLLGSGRPPADTAECPVLDWVADLSAAVVAVTDAGPAATRVAAELAEPHWLFADLASAACGVAA